MDIRISFFPKRPERRRETERPIVMEVAMEQVQGLW